MKYIFSLILIVSINSLFAQDSELVMRFKQATPNQLDTFSINDLTISDIEILTNYSIQLLSSNTDSIKFKGDVSLAVLFTHLCDGVKESKYDKHDDRIKQLLNKYKEFQYYCQIRPPDWLKLSHYVCQGKYEYIYSRLRTSPFFYPLIILVPSFIILYILFLIGIIKWKYRRLFLWVTSVFLVLLILIFIFFKSSCEIYVTQDSFYNISV